MDQVLVTETSLEDIADAIREKNGLETTYKPAQMAPAIRSLHVGGSAEEITYDNTSSGLDAENVQSAIDELESEKQDELTFDNEPTANSNNPVKSGGVYTALGNKVNNSDKGVANGIATLDSTGKVPSEQIPITIDSALSDSSTNPVQNKVVKSALDDIGDDVDQLKNALTTKAEVDGAYPDLTAGQMLSKVESADSVPYNFRAVGHDATLEYTDAIVGGSVLGNQLLNQFISDSGNYADVVFTVNNNDNYVVLNGTSSSNDSGFVIGDVSAISGHKYFISTTGICEVTQNITYAHKQSMVVAVSSNTTMRVRIWLTGGQTYSNAKCQFICTDLTQMLGTTIADYVNTLETATSGAGVAWLRKHFPKLFTYQEYSAGEIVSVSGLSQHVTKGFNQWDEEWENGHYDNEGVKVSSTRIRSKNSFPCLPNTEYYSNISDANKICFYDYNKAFIRTIFDVKNDSFVTPNNAYYMAFSCGDNYGTTYNHDICINLSDPAKNGTYEPYQKRTYPLDDSLTLRGILKLDASNNLYADGDRYLPDGTVQRRYGVVDLGTLNWTKSGNPQRFEGSAIPNAKAPATTYTIPDIMTDIYMPTYSSDGSSDRVIVLNINGEPRIYDSAKYQSMSASEFKTAMNGVMCVYELATQTTENADHYTTPQIVDPDGTEEYVSTSIVPVGHESRYPDDLRAKLDALPWNLSMIAPIENGDKASQAYAVGKYFLHNNQFCKAKTAIASGATLTLNTNYEVTTVADEIYSALH